LLHVLQDNEFSRLGGRSTTKVDVRVIAATNINVQEALAKKTLRPDLYYRLNGLSLKLPPLRERREEIPILLRHFMRQFSEKFARSSPVVSDRIVQACLAYGWPGNLRELQNFAKRYIVLGDEDLAISDLMGGVDGAGTGPNGGPEGDGKLKSIIRNVKSGAETIAIADALQQTDWKRKKAAALLGISYKALLYKMRQFGITPPTAVS
jgi:two-component system, NtrC family, response regulator AtoC